MRARQQDIYRKSGLRIIQVHAGKKSESLRVDTIDYRMRPIDLNTSSTGEHVSEIERYIRTVKERARCVWKAIALCES